MPHHYHDGSASQAPTEASITYLVAGFLRYRNGMAREAKELKALRDETGLGQKEFGALLVCKEKPKGYSDAQINRWEKGVRGLTDEATIIVAEAMTLRLRRPITPFQVKPDFSQVQVGPLKPQDRAHHLEALALDYEKRAHELLKESAPRPEETPAEPPQKAKKPAKQPKNHARRRRGSLQP